jgi:glycosyltransferase involved in cell wall biosynthesis
VREVLAAADVLLAPSWEEPFGRSVVEAMAMETPVVASREGGPSESLRAEVDGFLAPARRPDEWVEPTARLLDSSDLRARMGQSARQRAQELFDTRVIVTRLLEYYERLLS